ncbi:hypothetical protein FRB95_008321 [Tulasnella sp. JGI-2019a]|nr:hypothetical protein FRB95_008321 [Tulasnella sp. JGI-2019a]
MEAPNMSSLSLVASILSLLFQGFYICLFAVTIWVLRQRNVSMRSPSVILISLVFILSMVDAGAVFYTTYRGFILYPAKQDVYFVLFNIKQVDNGWYAVMDFCLSIAGYCADLLMCYRTYIIWSRDKRVLYLPILMFPIGAIGCIALVIFDALANKSGADAGFPLQYYAVSVSLFSLTITMTWYFTGLICYRLFSVQWQNRAVNEGNVVGSAGTLSAGTSERLYRHIFRVMIQSGLLYSLTQLSFLICFITENKSGQIIIGYLNIRIIGIVTALIMLQLHTFDNGMCLSCRTDHRPERRTFTTHSMPVFRAIGTTGTAETTGPDEEKTSVDESPSNAPTATSQLRFLAASGEIFHLSRRRSENDIT